MPDLRTLSLEARQSLAAEVERRARAGEAPKDIRAALGLTVRSYSAWAKLFGFRQCDLFPDKPRAGAPQKLAPGQGGYARSGRVFRGLPPAEDDGRYVSGEDHPAWTGGAGASRTRYNMLRDGRKRTAMDTVEGLTSARQVLEVARAAIEAGDRAEADRLVAGWRSKVRRDKAMTDLERAAADETRAAGEGSEPALSDAELAAEVSAMLGRAVRISGPSSES